MYIYIYIYMYKKYTYIYIYAARVSPSKGSCRILYRVPAAASMTCFEESRAGSGRIPL